jgi:tight adherence protein B
MRRALLIGIAAAALTAPAAAQASTGLAIRHVDLSKFPLVRVTAVAPAGARPSLSENGAPAAYVTSRELGAQEALMLAVDNSESMQGDPLREAKSAAGEFLAGERRAGSIGLVAFAHEALSLTRPSESKDGVLQTLAALVPGTQTGTSLYDAVELSVARLQRMSAATRILVLLTDGRDVGSHASLSKAIASAQRAGVVVYAIAVGARADRAPLEALASATGGRVFGAAQVTDLSAAYGAVSRELDRTWQLSFLSRARPGDRMQLGLTASGLSAATAVPIPGGNDTAVALSPSIAHSPITAALVVLLAALLFAASAVALYRRHRKSEVRRLLSGHLERLDRPAGPTDEHKRFDGILDWTERSIDDLPGSERLARMLESSGFRLRLGYVPYIGGATAIFLAVVATAAGAGAFFAILLMLAGLAAPLPLLQLAARRRRQAFDRQLPDVLATVASTLRAGHGLRSALRAVADDGSPPASQEFTRVLGEERLGRPLDQAITAMCARIGSPDLEYVATAINVQSQAGGSLATLFDTLSETVRERQRHARKVRALTSMGRMSATILLGLPFGLVALMTMINPVYMKPFFTTPTGHGLIGYCLVSMTIGALILKRVVSVRY